MDTDVDYVEYNSMSEKVDIYLSKLDSPLIAEFTITQNNKDVSTYLSSPIITLHTVMAVSFNDVRHVKVRFCLAGNTTHCGPQIPVKIGNSAITGTAI